MEHVLYTSLVIYFLYTVISFSFVKVTALHHYLFVGVTGVVLFVWFVAWGMSASKKANSDNGEESV